MWKDVASLHPKCTNSNSCVTKNYPIKKKNTVPVVASHWNHWTYTKAKQMQKAGRPLTFALTFDLRIISAVICGWVQRKSPEFSLSQQGRSEEGWVESSLQIWLGVWLIDWLIDQFLFKIRRFPTVLYWSDTSASASWTSRRCFQPKMVYSLRNAGLRRTNHTSTCADQPSEHPTTSRLSHDDSTWRRFKKNASTWVPFF